MSEEQRVTIVRNEQPYSIKLKRSCKGVYSWEIDVSEANPDALLYLVDFLETELRKRFGGGEKVGGEGQA